jgi:hypothetical protein
MFRRLSLYVSAVAVFFAFLGSIANAQNEENRASTPLVNPADTYRFRNVTEDWTTPALNTSHLLPAAPLGPFVDDNHPEYTMYLLRLQWRAGDPLDFYLLKPTGIKNPPVILNLYGYPTDTDPYKIDEFQKRLVKDGFAAVGFVSALTGHRYHDRPWSEWFVSELQESLGKSAHDVQMVLNYLEARGDVDMTHVGMFAQGSGATIAILASAVDPRIKVLDVLDPWGDWPVWLKDSSFVPEKERPSYLTPEFLKKAATLETLDWLPKVQARKFRFQQAMVEKLTPQLAKDKMRAAVPAGATVVVYDTFEAFDSAFPYSTNLDWVKQQLRGLPQDPAPKATASATAKP